MKTSHLLVAMLVLTAIGVNMGCLKNASTLSLSKATVDSSVTAMLQDKWQYSFLASCPPNPLSEAPCYEFSDGDTTFYGNGTLFLNITADGKIYRSGEGNFRNLPFSWVYTPADTLAYQMVSDSAFVLLNSSNQVMDTVKIRALSNNLLVLDYVTQQFGNTFEIDSLKR